MRLSWVLEPDFPRAIRARGASYYSSHAVRLIAASEANVNARVRGSRSYDVEISYLENGEVDFWCDCSYFDSSGPCKHLWAVILAAEAEGHLGKITNSGGLFPDLPSLPPLPQKKQPAPKFVPRLPPAPRPPDWQQRFASIANSAPAPSETWPPDRQLLYIVDYVASDRNRVLVLNVMAREPKLAGGWKKESVPRVTLAMLAQLPDRDDARVFRMLNASKPHDIWSPASSYGFLPTSYRVAQPISGQVLQTVVETGRCVLQAGSGSHSEIPLSWDGGEPWQFNLGLNRPDKHTCSITGSFHRGESEMKAAAPLAVLPGLLVLKEHRVALLDEAAPLDWIASFRGAGEIKAPAEDAAKIVGELLERKNAPPLRLPEDLRYEEAHPAPLPWLVVDAASSRVRADSLRARLSFDYEGRRIPDSQMSRGFYDAASARFVVRDLAAETAALQMLKEMGFNGPTVEWPEESPAWNLASKRLPAVARACLEAGWRLEADGKLFRQPGAMRVGVSSGVDWFELEGEVEYGDASVGLPELLSALRRGEKMVRLSDGAYGLLPEEWLGRFESLARLGSLEGGNMRFRRNQASLLDALLAAQPEVSCDATFTRVRESLKSFGGIGLGDQPPGFAGQLREYQREGLGWMEFLRVFGFGGCLADDMGVGKTAQVLAMLESRRTAEGAPFGPSLVVVPKSLVFNWKQEAARFTPQLRVLDYTGLGRSSHDFSDHDMIITTYGTLRRDAAVFHDLEFDYLVLDEAQAIKNAATESAKAARLLRGRNRLALSGTPVENHLGELWSLFEFLNPGMLGAASVFKLGGKNPDEETRRVLAQALRPFILRRTKEQVVRELPAKSEQTIVCELEPPQRKLYNELRAHYRASLLKTVDAKGLAKSKIQVLEALLRLRQAACHPALVDPARQDEPSAKIDVLLDRLAEVVEDGHKALVFSQFTSLLAIVRNRLDAAGVAYEYLDGKTRDRQGCVERFQSPSGCRVFLISLKAGGLGLNLTAADYVFLLDPWWNPAVEAQAVDRAHRIGQTRKVFTYRLIARDTVEEKVMQLQNSKRDLVNAIISEDNSLIRNLQREDLELLLS